MGAVVTFYTPDKEADSNSGTVNPAKTPAATAPTTPTSTATPAEAGKPNPKTVSARNPS
jgi:hypothetical protein